MATSTIHDHTQKQINDFLSNPSHALLLHAPPGSGKLSLARRIAARVLALDDDALDSHPYVTQIDAPAISSEAIETVRKLEHFLSLRVPSPAAVNRIVIISDAHALSPEAQNAMLKTIEEPPAATLLIFTADSPDSLLPTIRSRLQSIAVRKPTSDQIMSFFETAGHTTADINQAAAVSGGLPGLMSALLNDEAHPLKSATETARLILQSTLYDRLLMVDELSKQKVHLLNVLFIIQQMAHARLQLLHGSQLKRWYQILEACYEASDQLSKSAQPKLVLDSLMLKLN